MYPDPDTGPPGIDRDLGMVSAGVDELRQLASDREAAQDGARIYDFSIRWGVLLSGRLERLDHYHSVGKLTQEQDVRYRELRQELRDVTPEAERLGLARPNIGPED
jgi:hypothetical protein